MSARTDAAVQAFREVERAKFLLETKLMSHRLAVAALSLEGADRKAYAKATGEIEAEYEAKREKRGF